MTVREDYLVRMLREMAQVMAGVLRLIGLRRYADAHEAVRQAARASGLDLALLRGLGDATLLELFGRDPVAAGDRLVAASEALRLEGEVFAAEGEAHEATRCRARALRLLLHLDAIKRAAGASGAPPPELDERVDALVAALGRAAIPAELVPPLMSMREASGRYAEAETLLFELVRRGERGAREAGEAFYGRLLALPDHVLAAGDLPRDEVEDGLRSLGRGARG